MLAPQQVAAERLASRRGDTFINPAALAEKRLVLTTEPEHVLPLSEHLPSLVLLCAFL